jgi:tetratricopeptide (TPR) repeat protein
VATLTEYSKTGDEKKLEASLWGALDVGLSTLDDHGHQVVIIVDAVEEVTGTTPLNFHNMLREHVAKSDNAQAITFSKHISHISHGCTHLLITQKYIVDDVRSFLRQFLGAVPAFTALTNVAEDRVLQELTDKAGTSFLWANLAANLLAKEANSESLLKTVQALSSDLADVINRIAGKLSLKAGPARLVLSSLLVAHRPLTVGEVTELLSVDLEKKTIASGPSTDIFQELPRLSGSLAVIRDARIHFKSKAVREHMLTMLGKTLPSANDAHSELARSILLYAKLNLDLAYEPSFDDLSYSIVEERFASYPLLQYTVRNWLFHFRSAGMCGADGSVVLTSEFKEVFPDSTFFALLERSCWTGDSADLSKRYELALKVRESCFHDKGVSVLQTLIILGSAYQSHSHAEHAARYFYRALNVSQVVLSRSHTITMICSSRFLQITETMTFTTRTEIVTWRIRVIEFMIEETKRTKGAHSHAVIRWYEMLAELYMSINEEHNATLTRKLIYEIWVYIDGKDSEGARRIAKTFGGLDISLKDERDQHRIKEIQEVLLESDGAVGVEDTSVDVRLKLALLYISQKQWILAEEILITLWRSVSIACRLQASLTLHITKLRVAIEYIKFLRELKRVEEAVNILTVVWAEYEHQVFEDLTIVLRFKEIGLLFRSFGLLEVSLSIFTKIWGWFKSKGKATHEDAVETEIFVTQVFEEIVTTTTKTKTTTITTTETTEIVVKEIYETHYQRCKTSGKVDDAFFRSCFVLVQLYESLANWVQAEITIRQSLEITWKAIFAAEINIKLSQTHMTECIRLATSYAICLHRMQRYEEAERVYLRIFRACFGSLALDHACVKESLTVLIAFYEEHHRHEKVIEVYELVLERYRKHFGAGHAHTIEVLYILAAQCRMLGRKEEFTYYIEIITVLNKGRKHCHPDASKAAVLLIEYYYEHKQWTELHHTCTLLWESFLHHHKECVFAEHEIELIYRRYLYVLEVHLKVEYAVLYKLSKEYHTHVQVVFGATAAILIRAMIAYAGICERHHEHYHEAVTVYEEVITKYSSTKTSTVVITETEISTVKTRLSKVYVTIVTSGGKTTTTTFERAILISLELYAKFKLEYGCWHETTLGKLREIVLIYHKMGTQETRTKMIEILHEAFVSILTVSISSVRLYAAATTLAAIYVSVSLVEYAERLVQDVHHLIIFGRAFTDKEISLKLDVKLTKLAFVFLTAFRQRLVKETVWTYSEVMASLLLEVSLYEQYNLAVSSNSQIETILLHGAKLRFFWVEAELVHHRHLIAVLDQKLFALFKASFKAFLPADDAVAREFYVALVTELGPTRSTKIDLALLSCRAGNARVAQLLQAGEFRRAHEVARCVFHFASKQRFYNGLHRVHYGYKLAEFMAGVDVRRPTDTKLAEEMLKTSREILAYVLEVFKEDGVDFFRLNFKDLAGIIRLLGYQGNYAQLEVLSPHSPLPQIALLLTSPPSKSSAPSGLPGRFTRGPRPASCPWAASSCTCTAPTASSAPRSRCATGWSTTSSAARATCTGTPSTRPRCSPRCTPRACPRTPRRGGPTRRWTCTRPSCGRSNSPARRPSPPRGPTGTVDTRGGVSGRINRPRERRIPRPSPRPPTSSSSCSRERTRGWAAPGPSRSRSLRTCTRGWRRGWARGTWPSPARRRGRAARRRPATDSGRMCRRRNGRWRVGRRSRGMGRLLVVVRRDGFVGSDLMGPWARL